MTTRSDLDPVLLAWFEDGPSVMPDRVLEVVATRIGRERQRRGWRLPWRTTTVNRPIFYFAGVAAALAVAIAAWNLLPRSPGVGGSPTPGPTPTASPPALAEGTLEPGDYVARALPGDRMTFIVTAPAGWSGFGGWAMSGQAGSHAPAGVMVALLHDPAVVADPCSSSARPSSVATKPTVEAVVAALSARGDLEVSASTDTTLAGFSGKRLDLRFPATLACDQQYVFAEPQGLYGQGPANQWRIWVIDVGGESAVIVLSDFDATPAANRAAAQAVIDSIRINP